MKQLHVTHEYPNEKCVILPGKIPLELVLIPAGSFQRCGSEQSAQGAHIVRPAHTVTIREPFYMGKYLITHVQRDAVMGVDDCRSKKRMQNPWVCITEAMCQEFLDRLGGLQETFRLPSEAEWEYACRAGSQTAYCYGEDAGQLGEYAWYEDNSEAQLHPVGQKKPNAWGLYDMHGNVWELCADDWHTSFDEAPRDGQAWLDTPRGNFRVCRGGDWGCHAVYCRSDSRFLAISNARIGNLGIRVVCEAS